MGTGQGKQPTIFLIEEDDDTRAVLKQSLSRYGYRLSVAIDEEDALDRVSNGPMSADLVLINLVGKSVEDTLQMGRRVREQAKLDGNTPLVVMAEKYGKDLEGTEENVGGNDWIFHLGEEPEQLQNLLRRLTGRDSRTIRVQREA
jgi:PleD family two-component response regulator